MSKPTAIGGDQLEMLKRHLALVFKHEIDPSMGQAPHQEVLNELHDGANAHMIAGGSPLPGGIKMRC